MNLIHEHILVINNRKVVIKQLENEVKNRIIETFSIETDFNIMGIIEND